MSNITCVYLDVDGVLVDCTGAVYKLLGVKDWEKATQETVQWNTIHIHASKHLEKEMTAAEVWETVERAGSQFWASLQWKPFGKDLYKMCAHKKPVCLLTKPTRHPDSSRGKHEWINRNSKLLDKLSDPRLQRDTRGNRRYALSPCKHHFAHSGAVLVDDSENNVELFNEYGGKAYLWPAPWNKNRDKPLERALKEVEKMLDE